MPISIITSPSSIIQSQMVSRLSDVILGWAPTYAAAIATGQYPKAPATMTFDFASVIAGRRSENVFLGRLKPETIVSAAIFKFPLLVFYTRAAKNTNMQKFRGFAGPVAVNVDVVLGGKPYNADHALNNYEDWPNAVESTFLSIVQPAVRQTWNSNTVYNGDLGWQRSEVVEGAESWIQAVQFSLTFDVIL